MAKKFKPTQVYCTQDSTFFNVECKSQNRYRFLKGVPYLIKNKEDYDELMALPFIVAAEEDEAPKTRKRNKIEKPEDFEKERQEAEAEPGPEPSVPEPETEEVPETEEEVEEKPEELEAE